MKKIELLAPAGSFEKAKTAFKYGADAVYCGTSSLSLRTRADMQDDDLEKTVKYAHSIGKKVYVTLNIFAWDEKYDEIIDKYNELLDNYNILKEENNSLKEENQKLNDKINIITKTVE